jgi:hypothetical protein
MDLGTAIIFTSTVINIVYYIPQMYNIYINKNFNLYDLPPQVMLSGVAGLNVFYAVLIKDKELMISNICNFTLATIELIFMGYYAYFNLFAQVPHERFSKRDIKLDAIDLEV